ncbi:putative aminopeptidase [Thermoclostridium stercorarium subsp. stercorarium DSM 8532]|uniref:Putative aminopeptidase n=1 Tax=Thermoclostridium stercorarium (strain ATCC 35414 / DSM 8532 / NCIMB 11754) TaxID=1121335 RepID=L7VNW3_THES1|nr:M28 family metallopeptidase [Thermoclostridium stercorarium]AGC67218.1 putative aminopeptidase [Thermoclostridium stercorarium subsp. stercorarium DSM 8532]AGI38292.1 aminopeptidase [Thermoclostridium stercorarium subsp. stercorarium DSM 8532]
MKKIEKILIALAVIFLFSACEGRNADNFIGLSEIDDLRQETSTKKEAESNSEACPSNTPIPSHTPNKKSLEALQMKPEEAIEKHLQALTKNGPRKWGTENEQLAANYIKERMEEYGYSVQIQVFPAYEYDIAAVNNADYFNLNPYNSEVIGEGRNVIAELHTRQNTDKYLILCAHYDTVSKELGIIDNTSGVLTLLELARQISESDLPYNLRFIFFSSEERFLIGSRYYVSNLSEDDLDKIIACINIDMVGYVNGQEVVIATPYFANDPRDPLAGIGNALTDEWQRIFPQMNTLVQYSASSDHYPFEVKGIPNMMITQKYFDYETVRKKDSDFENLSIDELVNTVNLLKEYIINLNIDNIYYSDTT